MAKEAEQNRNTTDGGLDGYVGSLSPSAQIAYATSELHKHGDDNLLEWDASIRRSLRTGGFACMLLANNAPTVRREPKSTLLTPEPEPTPTPTSSNPDYPNPRGTNSLLSLYTANSQTSAAGLSTTIHKRDPSQQYTFFVAPKLAMIIVSPPIRTFFEQHPHLDEFVIPNPYGDFKPSAIRLIALWICQLLQAAEPRPIDSMADCKTHPRLVDALDIRVAMQLLGMEEVYLPHFVPLYTASLSQRKPTTLEAKAVVAHVVPEVCSVVEDDEVVGALAERLGELERMGRLNKGVWGAFLRKESNRGLLVAVQKNGAFGGVETVGVTSPPKKVEYKLEGDVLEMGHESVASISEASAEHAHEESDQELQEAGGAPQEEGVRVGKKGQKNWKSQVTSKVTAGWGKVRRIASGSSSNPPRRQ